jgi:hypothetical protein
MTKRKNKWYKPTGTTQCGRKRWAKDKSVSYRHTVLKCIANRDSYARAVRKMSSLANVTKDAVTKRKAKADMKWLQSQHNAGKI